MGFGTVSLGTSCSLRTLAGEKIDDRACHATRLGLRRGIQAATGNANSQWADVKWRRGLGSSKAGGEIGHRDRKLTTGRSVRRCFDKLAFCIIFFGCQKLPTKKKH